MSQHSKAIISSLLFCLLSNVNAQTASISGRITAAAQGVAAVVTVYRLPLSASISPETAPAYITETASDGSYTINAVSAGTYYLVAEGTKAKGTELFIKEFYPDLPCTTYYCTPTKATPIIVAEGSKVTGIDLSLALGGNITGIVTDGTNPIAGIIISLSLSPNSSSGISVATTGADGRFAFYGKEPGAYTVSTSNQLGYVNARPNSISLGSGLVSNVMLTLTRGAIVNGYVFDRTTNKPVRSARVSLSVDGKSNILSATTNSAGLYSFKTGIATNGYKIRVGASGYYTYVLGCGDNCSFTSTTSSAQQIVAPAVTSLNFTLLARKSCLDLKDSDNDGVANCYESCDLDPAKTEAGICGCGVADQDLNQNGITDCFVEKELKLSVTSLYKLVSKLKPQKRRASVGSITSLKVAADELVRYLNASKKMDTKLSQDKKITSLTRLIRRISYELWNGKAEVKKYKRKLQRLLVDLSRAIK